ncbi:putative transporter [Aphelenchoides besseyi]|nr:putative transporter [Aphelenchoides besseyi]
MPLIVLKKQKRKQLERAPLLDDMDSTDEERTTTSRPGTPTNLTIVNPDDVLDKFSLWNPYILFVFIAASSVWLFSGPNMMVSAFTIADVCASNDLNCLPNNNTINGEFNLVGSKRYLADWTTSMYLFGNTIGAAFVARITDYKGRRIVMTISLFLMGCFGVIGSFMRNIYLLMILRFLQGMCFPGAGIPGWNIAYESTPKSLRIYTTFCFGTMWVTGYCLVAPLAMLFPYWRTLMVACSFPSVVAGVVYFFTVPESFHYMVHTGMESELNAWVKKASVFNKHRVEVNVKGLIAAHHQKAKQDTTKDRNIIIQVVKNRRLSIYMLIMAVLWISDTLIYYGLSLFSTQLAGNKYMNYVLLGLIEAPSNFFSPYFLRVFGRRYFISGTHGLAAIAFLLLIFIKNPTGALILWLIGKFGIICSFNCLYVYCSELFPTNIRSGCTGACEAIGRLASTMAPALYSLKTIYVELPTIIFTALAGVSGGITLLLPETKDAKLPDTAADLMEQSLLSFDFPFFCFHLAICRHERNDKCLYSWKRMYRKRRFDLQGSRARLADFSTSAYACGSMFGALGLTRIADLKGRRPVAIFSCTFSGVLGCLAAFVPNIWVFMFVRLLQGIAFVGCSINSWVLAYESLPKQLRDYSTLVFGCSWVVGYVLVLAYAFPSWRILMFVCSVPCVVAGIAFYFYLPESFRFMVMHEKRDELDRFLSRVKGTEPQGDGVDLNADVLIAQYHRISEPALKTKFFTELGADKLLIACTVVLSYLWLYETFVYYGLSLFSGELAGNKYVNYVLLGLVETPANIVSPYLLNWFGRKIFITGSHLLASMIFVTAIFATQPTLSVILWLVGKSVTVCAFNALFVSASEIFPTTIRSGCIGICEIMARIGAATAPIFHTLENGDPQTMKIIYAGAGLVGTIASLIIPETGKIPLPDTSKKTPPSNLVE